ncbi:MAG: RluA family pseudouridine synthase [Candidatus Obscuribacterales bacterium]|jgi:23S rRNA pseudouridine1911/1915/1917 synthase|nr:RluA family pseudouridine synthase [Candidatus Obscuribacterales bacterium]
MTNELIELIVALDDGQPCRLDQYLSRVLAAQLNSFSRARVQKLIEDGMVLLNGKPTKSSYMLCGNEQLSLTIPAPTELSLQAEAIALEIVFEDQDLLVINKPAGLVVHPGAGVPSGTLVNALLAHCKESLSGIAGTLRPGIVHRLDKDTSGLLVVAKNDNAQEQLSKQISERSAKRVYLALLEGQLQASSGVVDKAIGRHKSDRTKMAITADGRTAVTHFAVEKSWDKFTLVKASLKTGRTHQIRVHMASLNCPVVGDIVYNRKSTGTLSARKKLGLNGQALHATYLSFKHPTSGVLLEFEAALPEDFQHLIESL